MSAETTRIHCSIDLESPGRRVGRLEVRHSDNRHAYGIIPVPIACIGNGRGPTAPVTAVVSATADSRSLSGAADRHAVANLATELGGGGTVALGALEVGDTGTRRWLAHVGLLEPDLAPPAVPTRFLRTRGRRDFVAAPMDGLFEPRVGLGDEVKAGDIAGIVHPVDDPVREDAEVQFSTDGIVLCRRVPARTIRGDYLFHLGEPVGETALRNSVEAA